MWITDNYTPFAVAGSFACDRMGRKHWVVAVRATFVVEDNGQLTRDKQQVPVSLAPSFRADPANTSLLHDVDLCLTKSATDVIVDGHAWAPGGRPAPVVDVGFRIGPVRKTLRVHGERVWTRAAGFGPPAPSAARPFQSMPVTYERAFGGHDPKADGFWATNPVGRGYSKSPASLVDTLLPNVEDPRDPLRDAGQCPRGVAGFGAIAAHWPQRVRFAGSYDERWRRERAPLWPEDFDPRFFQAAPEDQQVAGFLRGGEDCTLHNMTPCGSLRFRLPAVQIKLLTQLAREERAHEAQLHTVLMQPEQRRLTMVWNSALECHGRDHLLERSLIRWEGSQTWVESRPST